MDAIFRAFAGSEASSLHRLKPPQVAAPLTIAEGPLGSDLELIVQHQPGRIDVMIRPAPQEGPEPGIVTFDFKPDLVNGLLVKAIEAQKKITGVYRQSAIAHLAKLFPDTTSMLQASAKLIGGINLAGGGDFILQFNRPMGIAPERKANRVIRWNTEVNQFQEFSPSVVATGAPTLLRTLSTHYLVCVIDVNTLPHGQIFTDEEKAGMLKSITQEMVKMRDIESLEDWV